MKKLFNFFALCLVKFWARFFYIVESKWVHEHDSDPWKKIQLLVFLNHTSLYEPLFMGGAPYRFLWRIAGKILIPAADTTMERKFIGKALRFVSPKLVPISRKRDESWDHFMSLIDEDSLVAILPEGRMKRTTGLDKHGNPMSVRGGIADIIEILGKGNMVIIYSGGLHHVQVPGEGLPKLWQTIRFNAEKINIEDYIADMEAKDDTFKSAVTKDLEERMSKHLPHEQPPLPPKEERKQIRKAKVQRTKEKLLGIKSDKSRMSN